MHHGDLLLATRSKHKAREIREILALTTRARILSLEDAGIPYAPAEDGIEVFDSFLANAHAKADYFLRIARIATIADDSGISVDALRGAPGVRSKRFAPVRGLDDDALDHANNDYLLQQLQNVPDERRTAHYTCAAVLHLPDGRTCAALGVRSGRILPAPRGTFGFGYDPLFLDLATRLSFGEMDPRLKNRTSHRARAFRTIAALL